MYYDRAGVSKETVPSGTQFGTPSEKRFKQTLRVSRGTFQFILNRIRHDLERDVVCEDPIPPDTRLAICLYRLGRGDYYFTIAEMFGVGVSTVAAITEDVREVIVNNLWKDSVVNHFPKNAQAFLEFFVLVKINFFL